MLIRTCAGNVHEHRIVEVEAIVFDWLLDVRQKVDQTEVSPKSS